MTRQQAMAYDDRLSRKLQGYAGDCGENEAVAKGIVADFVEFFPDDDVKGMVFLGNDPVSYKLGNARIDLRKAILAGAEFAASVSRPESMFTYIQMLIVSALFIRNITRQELNGLEAYAVYLLHIRGAYQFGIEEEQFILDMQEWHIYQLADMLFERALIEIKLEKEERRVTATENITDIAVQKATLCQELISKMSSVPLLDTNKVFEEIREIYDENYWVPGFKETFETKKLTEVLCQLGYIFYSKKQYEKAYTWFYRSSDFYEESEDLPGLAEADCYEQLGNLCYDMENYEKAVAWYNEALFIRHKVLRLPFRDNAKLYLHVAQNLVKRGDRKTAKSYLKNILDFAEDEEIRAEAMNYLDMISDL